jgi:hypothetical protein
LGIQIPRTEIVEFERSFIGPKVSSTLEYYQIATISFFFPKDPLPAFIDIREEQITRLDSGTRRATATFSLRTQMPSPKPPLSYNKLIYISNNKQQVRGCFLRGKHLWQQVLLSRQHWDSCSSSLFPASTQLRASS